MHHDHADRLAAAFHETGRGLLIGVGLTCLAQGLAATLIYLALGVPRALVLGPLTGVAAVIPLVGTGLIWAPIALGLFLSDHPIKALILTGLGLGVIGVIDNVLRPVFARMGSLHLPTILVELLGQTDLVLTAPARVLQKMARRLKLHLFEPPLPLAGFTLVQVWHARDHGDAGHRWLERLLASDFDPNELGEDASWPQAASPALRNTPTCQVPVISSRCDEGPSRLRGAALMPAVSSPGYSTVSPLAEARWHAAPRVGFRFLSLLFCVLKATPTFPGKYQESPCASCASSSL